VIAASVVSLLVVAASPVTVVNDACPSGAEVEAALASMLSGSSAAPARPDVAKLEHAKGALRIELSDPDGAVIAERTLDGAASCAELGRMAAIVIASWESDVHPEFARQPTEIARVEHSAIPEPELPAPVPVTTLRAAAYDVAAGVTLGQADTLAAGASVGGAWFPRGVGLGLWVLGTGELARTMTVGAHEARWQRWTASLELAGRWVRDGFVLDAHGGPALGWVTTEGVDYAQNLSDTALVVGGTAGLRTARWLSRRVACWIDVRGFYFPRADSIYGTTAGTPAAEAALPGWGGAVSLGVALGRGPISR
jgi:hypothetical protein